MTARPEHEQETPLHADVARMCAVVDAWSSHADPGTGTHENAMALRRILDALAARQGAAPADRWPTCVKCSRRPVGEATCAADDCPLGLPSPNAAQPPNAAPVSLGDKTHEPIDTSQWVDKHTARDNLTDEEWDSGLTARPNAAPAAAAPSKGAPLVYDPGAYRIHRQTAVEAILSSFAPDGDEAAELLDCLVVALRSRYERYPNFTNVEHYAGQLRFYLVRLPS